MSEDALKSLTELLYEEIKVRIGLDCDAFYTKGLKTTIKCLIVLSENPKPTLEDLLITFLAFIDLEIENIDEGSLKRKMLFLLNEKEEFELAEYLDALSDGIFERILSFFYATIIQIDERGQIETTRRNPMGKVHFDYKTASQLKREIQENEERNALQGIDAVAEFFNAVWEKHNIEETLLKQQETTFKVLSLSFDETSMARYREKGEDVTFLACMAKDTAFRKKHGGARLYFGCFEIEELCILLGIDFESLMRFEKESGFHIDFYLDDMVYDCLRRKTCSVKECNVYCRVGLAGV